MSERIPNDFYGVVSASFDELMRMEPTERVNSALGAKLPEELAMLVAAYRQVHGVNARDVILRDVQNLL